MRRESEKEGARLAVCEVRLNIKIKNKRQKSLMASGLRAKGSGLRAEGRRRRARA
jgi:hypothetical protein